MLVCLMCPWNSSLRRFPGRRSSTRLYTAGWGLPTPIFVLFGCVGKAAKPATSCRDVAYRSTTNWVTLNGRMTKGMPNQNIWRLKKAAPADLKCTGALSLEKAIEDHKQIEGNDR